MSYMPTVWQDEDVITDVKLNKIEQGIADASDNVVRLVFDETHSRYTLDKTGQQIVELVTGSNGVLFPYATYEESVLQSVVVYNLDNIAIDGLGLYVFTFVNSTDNPIMFDAETLSDYPVLHEPET